MTLAGSDSISPVWLALVQACRAWHSRTRGSGGFGVLQLGVGTNLEVFFKPSFLSRCANAAETGLSIAKRDSRFHTMLKNCETHPLHFFRYQ